MEQNESHLDEYGQSPQRKPVTGDDCETVRALIPAYSLGATDPDETQLVESLLEYCPEAAAELADYDVVAKQLLYSAPPTSAPTHLREKVLASVRSSQSRSTANASPIRSQQSIHHHRTNRPWQLALAAAVLAIALLSLSNLYWAAQITALQNMQQEFSRRLDDHSDVLTLIGAGETQRIELWNPGRTLLAAMLCNPEEPLGFVYAEDLPPLPPGQVYQVWLVQGQQRIRAGSFVVDEEGEGSLVFRLNEPLGRYQSAEITVETADASQPTSPALVSGALNF
jgi:hypothetical protein